MSTFRFERGKCYVVTIKLTGLKATFGDADDVKEAIEDLGLKVTVNALGDNPDGHPIFRAKGTWTKPTETVELPDEVQLVQVCLPDRAAPSAPLAPAQAFKEAVPVAEVTEPGTKWGALGALAVAGAAVAFVFRKRS